MRVNIHTVVLSVMTLLYSGKWAPIHEDGGSMFLNAGTYLPDYNIVS